MRSREELPGRLAAAAAADANPGERVHRARAGATHVAVVASCTAATARALTLAALLALIR